MSETEQRETEIVTGMIEGVLDKGNGRWQVLVRPDGSQYTKNLWTKSAEVVAKAEALKGQRRHFRCSISNYTRQDGSPARSLWLNDSDDAGEDVPDSTTASGNGAPEAHHEPMHYADKDRAITRMACLKAAAEMLRLKDGTLEEQISDALTAAGRFETWVMRDIDPEPFV